MQLSGILVPSPVGDALPELAMDNTTAMFKGLFGSLGYTDVTITFEGDVGVTARKDRGRYAVRRVRPAPDRLAELARPYR